MVILPYATTLLSAGQAERAFGLLADASKTHALNPETYKLLAQAAGTTGKAVQTHVAMSQYYFLNGYTKQALEQLKLADNQHGISNYQAARIQVGIKNLEKVLEEEKLE